MVSNIDAKEAIEKTQEFLEEYHDSFHLISTELGDDNIWLVVCDVGFLNKAIKKVEVDAESGEILGYIDVSED